MARRLLVDDQPVNSSYVAYRGALPIEQARHNDISESDVVVYVGPGSHFVQYPLRGGEMFNQVAVFESPKALAGEEDWGIRTSWMRPSREPASRSSRDSRSCGATSGGGCSTATRS